MRIGWTTAHVAPFRIAGGMGDNKPSYLPARPAARYHTQVGFAWMRSFPCTLCRFLQARSFALGCRGPTKLPPTASHSTRLDQDLGRYPEFPMQVANHY